MQYHEVIHSYELDELISNYMNTPFQNNIQTLAKFMRAHKILHIMLLQQSNEMVGVMGVYSFVSEKKYWIVILHYWLIFHVALYHYL